MTAPGQDDDGLLAELHAALQAHQDVPPDLLRAGKSVFDWRRVDAELAALTYDSASADHRQNVAVARDAAPPRALSFSSDRLELELEVSGDALRGQVTPALPASPAGQTIEFEDGTDDWAQVRCDEQGWFVITPPPVGPFRLTVRGEGIVVRTDWINP